MPTITDIKPQVKNKSRASIFLDNKFYCGMEKFTLLSYRLNIGDEVSLSRLLEIQQESESVRAFEQCAVYIGRRRRSRKEIEDYLKNKGYIEQVAETVINKLCDYKYIDDYRFCIAYIETNRHRLGEKRLRQQLKAFGVDSHTIEDAMCETPDQTDELKALANKYVRTHKNWDRQKLGNHLYARGFDYYDIKSVVLEIVQNLEEDNEDE